MFLEQLRLSARYGKAHGLLLKKRYAESAKLLESSIEEAHDSYMDPLLYEDLGICLYHLGRYSESYEIMSQLADRLLTEAVEGQFELDLNTLERVNGYIRANEKALGHSNKR